eukprot:8231463-Pyramimonas_sp.AAC.1
MWGRRPGPTPARNETGRSARIRPVSPCSRPASCQKRALVFYCPCRTPILGKLRMEFWCGS